VPQLIALRHAPVVRAPALAAAPPAPCYSRHAPEQTLLYALVQAHYPDFLERLAQEDRAVPEYVREEFDEFLRCGVLHHGFLRVACEHCHAERLVAFSCKKRGFCPSCGARRMAESGKHLVEDVFGSRPVRQWVLSVPYPLRFLFANKPAAIGPVLGIVQRVIAGWLADQAGVERASAQCGAVTLIQRFGSALNLNVHFHMLWLDGVYEANAVRPERPRLRRVHAPTSAQLMQLADTIARRVCRHLAKRGWLEGEEEPAFLTDSVAGDDGLDALRMSSITYRIATGKRAGPEGGDAANPARRRGLERWRCRQGRAASRCTRAWPRRRTNAGSWRNCAATSRARRSASGGCRSRRRAGCVTRSRRRGATARRMWSSSRWSSSPNWPRWSRRRART
jgi:ribosomal protein S27E